MTEGWTEGWKAGLKLFAIVWGIRFAFALVAVTLIYAGVPWWVLIVPAFVVWWCTFPGI